jgi:hypothetical protein
MSDTAAVFGAALAGAVVGGAATGVGSYFVGRTQRRHEARVSLYLDLLPALRTAPSRQRSVEPERTRMAVTHDVVRIANVAGGRAVGLAKALDAAVEALDRPATDEQRAAALAADPMSPERFIDRSVDRETLDRAIDDFDAWLERKAKGGLASLRPW